MSGRAALLSALVAAIGCKPVLPGSYHCATSSQCTRSGAQGVCEPSGACSFPDASCASGRRYGQYGPDGLASACVDAADSGTLDLSLPDAGDGGAPDAAAPVITRVGASKLAPSARKQAVLVPAPSGIVAGDLLLACLYAGDNSITITPPAGWSEHAAIGGIGANYRAVWYSHVAAASEPPGYAFGLSVDTTVAAAIVAYRGVAPAAPFDAATNRQFQAMPFTAPSITTTHAGDMLVAMFVEATQTMQLAPPSGMSTAVDDTAIYIYDALQPAAGPTGTKTAGNVQFGVGAVDFVALTPAP
jgi:hypothetical protein